MIIIINYVYDYHRLEQAQIIVEMQESMSDFDTKSTSMVGYLF